MSRYADVLKHEDARIAQMFDVEKEAHHTGAVVIEDPFPALQRLLSEAPVHNGALAQLLGYKSGAGFQFHLDGHPTYSALSFNAVNRTLVDNKVFSSEAYALFPQNDLFKITILQKIGDEHRNLRAPIQPLFNPDYAEKWWSKKIIDETVEALISNIEKKKSADLFLELCARMPMHVVSAAFGIAPEDIVPFRMAIMGVSPDDPSPQGMMAAFARSADMLQDVIDARRKKPEDDVISELVRAEVTTESGEKRGFTDEEIVAHCRLILLAGGGTTWRQLGITIFALLNNPDQMELIREDRSLLPNTILESTRWHATDLLFPRMTTEDVTLEGVEIPKGAIVHMCLGAANRDPTRWNEPEKFDITRPIQRAVGFGGGPHSCLGQHVSRQEMVTALNGILDRLPNLRWDTSEPRARLTGGLFARGPSALPVVFG
jgi:cytochrome P450